MTFALLAALACLALNAFFVLAEFAIVKVRETRLEELAGAGDRRASLAREIVRNLDAYLSVCQLGITVASLGLGWLGEPAFARFFEGLLPEGMPWAKGVSHGIGVVLAFCLVTFLHILFGELVPKALAIRRPDRAALATADGLRFFHRVFLVPMRILNACQDGVLRLLRLDSREGMDHMYSEKELRLILGLSERKGGMSLSRLLLFENLFDFGKLTVRDAMKLVGEAERLDVGASPEAVQEHLRGSSRSRLLVMEGERILGYVHVKDFWRDLLTGIPPDPGAHLRTLLELKEGMRLEAALREMQRRHAQIALVTDDAGRTVGFLSLEDVLEELVGSIRDEFERQTEPTLAELVPASAVILDLKAAGPEPALRALSERLSSVLGGKPAAEAVFQGAWEREREIPTYLGDGVAVPHVRLEGLESPRVVLACSREGVPFPGGRAHLLLLIATPRERPLLQVQILARVAGLVQSAYVRERLLAARTPEEAAEIVRSGDSHTHSD